MPTNKRRTKPTLEIITESTPERAAAALWNRDPFTLLSDDDRQRFAGKIVVVRRVGEPIGAVLGHGASQEDAVRMAMKDPTFRSMDCSSCYIPLSGEHPVTEFLRQLKSASS